MLKKIWGFIFVVLFFGSIIFAILYFGLKKTDLVSIIFTLIIVASLAATANFWFWGRTRICELDKNHPCFYFAYDDLKLLFRNPFPKDKELTKYLWLQRAFLLVAIIFLVILLMK